MTYREFKIKFGYIKPPAKADPKKGEAKDGEGKPPAKAEPKKGEAGKSAKR